MKNLIPPQLRIQIRVFFIFIKDVLTVRYFYFVKKNTPTTLLPRQASMSQPIRKNDFSENKKENLRLATRHLENIPILPNQIFSFWNLIPPPTAKNGFKKGRNVVGNQLTLDYGGGLCQLSGILYHLVLEMGLEILERHPHSLDIYTEETRYTPLGSDATVVYGHKDLMFRNNLKLPISFQFEILENEMLVHICADQHLEKCAIDFLVNKKENGKDVRVIRHFEKKKEICSHDFYKNLKT